MKVGESKRFVVGVGRVKGRMCFFVKHKDINPGSPIPINPEDLSSFMVDAVRYLGNPRRNRDSFVKRWKAVERYI